MRYKSFQIFKSCIIFNLAFSIDYEITGTFNANIRLFFVREPNGRGGGCSPPPPLMSLQK